MENLNEPGAIYNKLQENNLYNKSFKLAKLIFMEGRNMMRDQNEYIISKQLIKSGTSIGANVTEALGGISVNDFSHKISIAYKESLETKYWLDLLEATSLMDSKKHDKLFLSTDEVAKILYTILKKTRINKTKPKF